MSDYDSALQPMELQGNVYLAGAKASKFDERAITDNEYEPGLQVVSQSRAGSFLR